MNSIIYFNKIREKKIHINFYLRFKKKSDITIFFYNNI
jgi:hypothetical protein